MTKITSRSDVQSRVDAYSDDDHLESPEGLKIGDHGYKYRELDGLIVPPYVTPNRYALSRRIKTCPGDVCYISYPKSGSTWLSNVLVRLHNNGQAPDSSPLRSHVNWVESSWIYPRDEDELKQMPSPRIFKSHMPYRMGLGGDPRMTPCKYIYIARNPKDVAVSYFHFESEQTWSGNYNGPWEHWLDMFLEGTVQRGDWFDHVLGWWENSDAENILFLKYEDMIRDFQHELRRITNFLEIDVDETTRLSIEDETAFGNMSTDKFANLNEIDGLQKFFREGRIGSWRDLFTEEQSKGFDARITKRLDGTGLDFRYE